MLFGFRRRTGRTAEGISIHDNRGTIVDVVTNNRITLRGTVIDKSEERPEDADES